MEFKTGQFLVKHKCKGHCHESTWVKTSILIAGYLQISFKDAISTKPLPPKHAGKLYSSSRKRDTRRVE